MKIPNILVISGREAVPFRGDEFVFLKACLIVSNNKSVLEVRVPVFAESFKL